jgi:hypothetical protein
MPAYSNIVTYSARISTARNRATTVNLMLVLCYTFLGIFVNEQFTTHKRLLYNFTARRHTVF